MIRNTLTESNRSARTERCSRLCNYTRFFWLITLRAYRTDFNRNDDAVSLSLHCQSMMINSSRSICQSVARRYVSSRLSSVDFVRNWILRFLLTLQMAYGNSFATSKYDDCSHSSCTHQTILRAQKSRAHTVLTDARREWVTGGQPRRNLTIIHGETSTAYSFCIF